jgi:hypothetical protein
MILRMIKSYSFLKQSYNNGFAFYIFTKKATSILCIFLHVILVASVKIVLLFQEENQLSYNGKYHFHHKSYVVYPYVLLLF